MTFVDWLHSGALARAVAGGKGAALSDLMAAGFTVPPGFCVKASAYRHFMVETALQQRLNNLDASDAAAFQQLRDAIIGAPIPSAVRDEVAAAYEGLTAMAGVACAVRSSAISEDGAAASFAGLYESYLNVRGTEAVLDAVQHCYASLWSGRAFKYRAMQAQGGQDEAMAVVVMALVPSETSGIAFTAHPVTGERDVVVINAAFGLGEAIVSGAVTPDCYVVEKAPLAVREREVYEKELALYPHPDGAGTLERTLSPAQAVSASLTDAQACEVARLAGLVEAHYGCPQDVEWGMAAGQVFLLQSRPITTL